MKVESGKTYVGVVEDNYDPKRLGRVKIRVLDVFDETPIEDIPFANPWKDLAGNEFNIPEVGKIVTVVFDSGNQNSPEFISSDHFNINLEKKLSSISKDDYESMKALIFDHKTQVYVNDSEGLILDHKFNKISVKESSINLQLKDNFSKINLGTSESTQRSILGDNFLNWFDQFINLLIGSPYFNAGGPLIANPSLIAHFQLYQQLKDPKFLSKNVYIADNESIEKLNRIAEAQKGDAWQSTILENSLTTNVPVTYKPIDGSTDTTFDKPVINAATQSISDSIPIPVENPDIKIIIEILNSKKYKLYEDVYKLNIVAVRNQCIYVGDKYTDQFVDKLYIIFKDENGIWQLKQYMFSTVPGLEFTITNSWLSEKDLSNKDPWIDSVGKRTFMKKYVKTVTEVNGDLILKSGLPILVPSQYVDIYYVSNYRGSKAMLTVKGAMQLVWRDIDYDNVEYFMPNNFQNPETIIPDDDLNNSIKIHLGYPSGQKVGNWSEGSQVFSNSDSLNGFFSYCDKHIEKWGNKFTYTLVTKNDWDEATKNVNLNKNNIMNFNI